MARNDRATFVLRDSTPVPAPLIHRFHAAGRALNPLAVLVDWDATDLRLAAAWRFRGHRRVVLDRRGERLYLEERSGVPVKLERIEPHATWGQVHVEYVYSSWWRSGAVVVPLLAVRHIDGVEHLRRSVRLPRRAADPVVETIARAVAFPPELPAADHRNAPDPAGQPVAVDTVRVDSRTVLLVTPAYTHAVTYQQDTVFLFDATTAEWRSRADSTLIAALFPDARGIVVVVTDLAWPHVAGLRFWVARGATMVTHEMSRPFLEQLLDRRWTVTPDAFEGGRRPWTIRTTRSGVDLAGGAVLIRPTDGPASEGALMAIVPSAGFLWAGDYVQTVSAPSQYAAEVLAAVRRTGITVRRVAAQHLELTPWHAVERANLDR